MTGCQQATSRHSSVKSMVSPTAVPPARRRKAVRERKKDTALFMVEEVEEDAQGSPQPQESASELFARATSVVDARDQLDLSISFIVDNLSRLDEYSGKVIKEIPDPLTLEIVAKTASLLANPDSKLAKRIKDFLGHFKLSKAHFGHGLYIDTTSILETLFAEPDPDTDSGRPDAIIYKANIASTFEMMLAQNLEATEFSTFCQELDDSFPFMFIPKYSLKDGKTCQEIFDLALEIRTQRVIAALQVYHSPHNCDPVPVIAQAFYQGGEEMSWEDTLRTGRARTIAGMSLAHTDKYRDAIAARIAHIRQATRDRVDMVELRRRFPWEQFLVMIIDWLQKRVKQCENAIKANGGAGEIVKSLLQALSDHDPEEILPFDSPAARQSPEPSNRNVSLAESAAEKEIRLRPASIQELGVKPLPRWRRPAHDRGGSVTAEPSNAPGVIPETPPRLANPSDVPQFSASWNGMPKEKNKENYTPSGPGGERATKRFLDTQPGASKVPFNESEDENDLPPLRTLLRRKRNHSEANTDNGDSMYIPQKAQEGTDSEDECFQVDGRAPARPGGESVARGSQSAQPSPKRQRVKLETSGRRSTIAEAGRNPKRRRLGEDEDPRRRRLEEDEESDGGNSEPSYADIQARARARSRMTVSLNRSPIRRKDWEPEECAALVDLIRKYGVKWSTISNSEDARRLIANEKHREQMALRDKARNLKVSLLLAQKPLPKNFDAVILHEKELARVKRAGLNPWRKENEAVGEETVDDNRKPKS